MVKRVCLVLALVCGSLALISFAATISRRSFFSGVIFASSALNNSQPPAQSFSIRAKENFDIRSAHRPVRWNSLNEPSTRRDALVNSTEALTSEKAQTSARGFLKAKASLFRLQPSEVDDLNLIRSDRSSHNGITHLTYEQRVNGIAVFQSEASLHLDRAGNVIAASGELVPNASRLINDAQPPLNAATALSIAADEAGTEIKPSFNAKAQRQSASARQSFDRSIGFVRDVEAELVYFPLTESKLRLAWQFVLWMPDAPDVYLIVIDAQRGSLLYRQNLTNYETAPHGLVFDRESPRPNLPQRSSNPSFISLVDKAFNGAEFFSSNDPRFNWWNGVTAETLAGNNASVGLDRNDDNQPDTPRLIKPDGNFAFTPDFTQSPTSESNQHAAQVNLFYWINRFHDQLYQFGFTESAGNFQSSNFNAGGEGNDAIHTDVQDGGGFNNANFTTLPDGTAPRMQMYLWSGNPQLDSAFDQTVIIHELTHGLSNRLIGNATGLFGLQAAGMGEGWSDFMAIALLAKESDELNAAFPMAQYSTNNFTRGIRRYPYSTNLSVNPLTFGKLAVNTQVHAIGEIWCSALWEVRAALIQQYGFKEGQRQTLQLIVDGMKLTPRAPSMTDARDAVLLADRVNHNGANQCLLWQAFAKRGLGYSASTLDTNDAAPVEAFDTPPWCSDSGQIKLDRTNYLNGETIQITLFDRNAVAPVKVQLSSSITRDRETITLQPVAELPGSFRGSLKVSNGNAVINDANLQASVEAGDQISVSYDDASSDGGSFAEVISTAVIAREKTIFEDHVEQGNQGWITSGDATSWGITSARAASARHSWTDSPNANYINGANQSLISPTFDLNGLSDVTLHLAHSFAFDNGFDAGIVEYSIDDGATWHRAAAFTGTQSNFKAAAIRLRGLDGQSRARVRFRLQSDARETADGWFVDDFRLVARSANATLVAPEAARIPVIQSISPAFGAPAGGATITISGINFTSDEDTVVMFGETRARSFSVLSNTTINAVAPAHAAGAVTVRVINRFGEAALGNGFTYFVKGSGDALTPSLVRVEPNSGSIRGGTLVTLSGSGFTPETIVQIGAQTANTTFISANKLQIVTPASATTGSADVSVGNNTQVAKLAAAFNYTAITPPAVEIITPAGGETFFAGSAISLQWRSSDNRSVAAHRLALHRVSGTTTQLVMDIAQLDGATQSFVWKLPADLLPLAQARLSVTAIDDEGATTEILSTGIFSLVRRWEVSAQLPTPTQEAAITSDGQYLYSIGGRSSNDADTAINSLLRFDPTSSRLVWTNLASMPTAVSGSKAVFLNGRIYLPGGLDARNRWITKQQVYDIASNLWDVAAELPVALANYAVAVDSSNGVFYLTGGRENGNTAQVTNKVRVYNPATYQWNELPPMLTARYGHEAALIEGRLYVIGGAGASGALAAGEVFDFNTNQWSAIPSLEQPRLLATSAVGSDSSGNPLWFVCGGWDNDEARARVEAYDTRARRWIALDDSFSARTPRAWLGGATINGWLYTLGGFSISKITGVGFVLTAQRTNERMRIEGINPNSFNQAPSLAVPGDQSGVANHELVFNISASDLGSNVPVNLTANGLPAGASFTTNRLSNNSTRGTLRWKPSVADTGNSYTMAFTASDGALSETKLVRVNVIAGRPAIALNSASYQSGALAPDSIATLFGSELALRAQLAETYPLPRELSGTTVTVNGKAASLLFVSPSQINFVIPAEVEPGAATIVIRNALGVLSVSNVQIAMTAPALFTADASGRGDASAQATVDGVNWQQAPFDVTVNGKPNVLVMFGTGLRKAVLTQSDAELNRAVKLTIGGIAARVQYAGAQGGYSGLDQINLELPAALSEQTARRVEVVLSVNGVAANRVTVPIR